jgi:hypothetical protein
MTDTCVAFLGFSGFLLTIVVIVFLAVNYILASVCDFSHDVLSDPTKANPIAELFPSEWNKLLSSDCLNGVGLPLTEYVKLNDNALVTNYNEIGLFLDGISHYKNFLRELNPDIQNNNMSDLVNNWEQYRIGKLDNFPSTQCNFH